MISLTWWEVEELEEHLSSRLDVWTQSEDDPRIWLRASDDASSFLCGIQLLPPSESGLSSIYELSFDWTVDHTSSYVEWLISNWTTRPQRLDIEAFLQTELHIAPDVAAAAAVRIASFDWRDHRTIEPSAPPEQEEFWPKSVPPTVPSTDASHVGTFLLASGGGWIRLRLLGGLLRAQLSVRTPSGEALALDGFVRPVATDLQTATLKLTNRTSDSSVDS